MVGLIYSENLKHLTFYSCFIVYCNWWVDHKSLSLLKPELISCSACLFSVFNLIAVILEICKSYITHSKYKINSTMQDAKENNVLLLQGTTNNDKEEALAGAATALSLLSPPTNNLNSQIPNQIHMKCNYNKTHCHFLDYLDYPILGDAIIYAGNTSFQYNKEEGRLYWIYR